ncbi:glutamate formimidoyltransferase, partial [bacterium]|nr:glutamate formimidoyltransferase [bacterium]
SEVRYMHLFQCIPNVSEGRDRAVVEALAEAVRAVSGVRLLDYSADRDHHRSVFTFIGAEEGITEAVLALFAQAEKHIDLRQHQGLHPRIGAVDVVPFVPLEGTSMEDAVALSRRVAALAAERYGVPVYYYEESALCEKQRSLAYLRRGGFEALAELEDLSSRPADVGPSVLHPRLGASCFGARRPLVAFNVLLDTADVEIAKRVARKIRFRDGGLRYVRALGLYLAEAGLAQVSINLLNTDQTALYTVLEMVKSEAKMYGAGVRSCELIGVMPLKALVETAAYYLRIPELSVNKILERGILDMQEDKQMG